MNLAAVNAVNQRPAELRTAQGQLIQGLLHLVRRERGVLTQGQEPVVDRLKEQDLPAHLLIITIPYVHVTGPLLRQHDGQVPPDRPSALAVTLSHAAITSAATDIPARCSPSAGQS